MKFYIEKASNFRVIPVNGAILNNSLDKGIFEIWTIEIETIEQLLELQKQSGNAFIIKGNSILIHDARIE